MKNKIVSLLMVVMVLGVLTACGSSKEESNKELNWNPNVNVEMDNEADNSVVEDTTENTTDEGTNEDTTDATTDSASNASDDTTTETAFGESEEDMKQGLISKAKFETFITEKIELTPENAGEYFEIVEEERYIYSPDGSEITGGYTERYMQLKAGYVVYPGEVTVTLTKNTTLGDDVKDYIFRVNNKKQLIFRDDVDMENCTAVSGTIIKLAIPEEYIQKDFAANYIYIIEGDDMNYFILN